MTDFGFSFFRQPQTDLFRTPALTDQRLNLPPTLKRNPMLEIVSMALSGKLMGLGGAITVFSLIAFQLTVDGSFMPPQDSTDFRRVMISFANLPSNEHKSGLVHFG
jgi:hypothetical protein